MSTNKPVTKLEDRDSDSSGDEGKITLSLSHFDSDNFLSTEESEEESPAHSTRDSIYSPRPPTKQSPRESVQSSRPPARKTYPGASAKRAKTEDSRKGDVLKLTLDTFKIRK